MIKIVGGGIAGLAAAFELQRHGADYRLLEATPRLGGILRTDYEGDLVIDAGPDAMLARKSAGIQLCSELGIAERLVPANPPRTAFVFRDGNLVALPGGSFRPASQPAEPEDESIATFFLRNFGQEAVDYYAEPVLAGIHAGDVGRLSIRALFPDMADPLAERRAADPQGVFRSFPGGMQELVDALVRALPADRVRVGASVPHIEPDGTPWIVATPAHAAARLVADLDPELAALCRRVPYVSSGIAVLAYPRAAIQHPLAGSGFVVPRVERDLRILAATWLSSKWPGRAPAGVALLRAFFGGARDPEAMTLEDGALVDMAHRDLSRVLRITTAPTFSRVYRWIDGTPQYEVGYLDLLSAIRVRAAALGLHLIGAGFGTIGIPDCIAAGREAARAASSRT